MPAPNVCVISKDFPSIATPISSCNVTGLVEEPMSYAETVLNAASKPVISINPTSLSFPIFAYKMQSFMAH